MENCVTEHVCHKCGKKLKEDRDYCDECLLDMKLEAEISEYEKQIEF